MIVLVENGDSDGRCARHFDIDQKHAVWRAVGPLKPLLRRRGEFDLIACGLEDALLQHARREGIIDDQHRQAARGLFQIQGVPTPRLRLSSRARPPTATAMYTMRRPYPFVYRPVVITCTPTSASSRQPNRMCVAWKLRWLRQRRRRRLAIEVTTSARSKTKPAIPASWYSGEVGFRYSMTA